MIADLKPYPAMKDSGVPWLGEVPEHWKVQTVGRLGQLFKGNGGSKADEVDFGIPCVRYGDLYTRHEFFITKTKACVSPERASAYTPIQFGDLLFAASGETDEDIGRSAVNLLQADARCGGDVLVLRPSREFVPRFLGYAADSHASRAQKATMGRGFTVVHIYGAQLKHLALAIPPLPEQTAIVRFLDYMDRRIRRYIRAKQKLIKLLEEQKQAIVHRAVTRGLDPNVRLKPSGVEWLGDVPEHWEVLPLKRIAWFKSGSGFPVNEQGNQGCELPFLRVSDMTREGNETWIETSDSTISRETAARLGALVFPAGTIIFPKVGGALLTNKRRILRVESCIDNNVMGCVVGEVNRDYVFLLLEQIDLGRLAKPGPVPAISEGEIREIRVALPPLGEQARILYSVRAKTASLAAAILSTQREITLLREYRTRLIADVVTGKLDVREAAAQLPQEAEELEPLDEVETDLEESNAGEDDVAEEVEA